LKQLTLLAGYSSIVALEIIMSASPNTEAAPPQTYNPATCLAVHVSWFWL